ncbi:DUF7660 family protein [Flavobacterium gawalongense]|uniref:DUF7660 domain-containing protein n=1 Tax=Flavobacterium gawalongense TaxID=2594432 RepID=A0ABY3CL78_9FLAO|nr:hypothetical protein [Flavobacterium gawalongense]TRX00132.1 hypothetical protein FNW33_13060 [Flavobacterium gawalongense]TRX04880.1 hypothetical protein FNW12_12535 [Flavobacterium gawalongense]
MDIYDKVEGINNQADFVIFLKSLKKDLKENKEDWENDSLERFLEGLYGYSMDKEEESPTWRVFAELLLGAKVYE